MVTKSQAKNISKNVKKLTSAQKKKIADKLRADKRKAAARKAAAYKAVNKTSNTPKKPTAKQSMQKRKRFSSGKIGNNKPTSLSAKKISTMVHPKKNSAITGYRKKGPNGETVRVNSKGKHYYINKNGNAVIVKKK